MMRIDLGAPTEEVISLAPHWWQVIAVSRVDELQVGQIILYEKWLSKNELDSKAVSCIKQPFHFYSEFFVFGILSTQAEKLSVNGIFDTRGTNALSWYSIPSWIRLTVR